MRSFIKRAWSSWKEAGVFIGDFQARLLLTLFYFTILVPFGLLIKSTGDPLNINRRTNESGWVKKIIQDKNLDAARRQY